MQIKETFVTNNPCYATNKNPKGDTRYTNFQKNGAKGLMLHSVGCNQPSAMVFVNAWNKSSYDRACVHAFIDGNTGVIHQCLPWNFRGWHGGGSSNNTHIGVEMCEPACIKYTGGSSFICSDTATAKTVVTRTYNAAVELFAFLCRKYNLNPLADGVIISHREGHARGVASNHGDPEHLWNGLKMGYTMDGFRKAVAAAMNTSEPEKPAEPAKTLYRVQTGAFSKKANADALEKKLKAAGFDTYIVQSGRLYKVQVGAYSVKANADAMAAKLKAAGFDTFITTSGGPAAQNTPETVNFKVGDKVKCKAGVTTYANGVKMSSWVPSATLYVRAVEKDGEILLVSTEKTKKVYTGRVKASDMRKE